MTPQDVRAHSATLLGLTAVLVVMLASFPLLMQLGWLTTHLQASIWCVLVWTVGHLAVVMSDPRRLWSPAAIFFVIFAFFHYGMAIVVLLHGSTDDIWWFDDPLVPQAFALVGLGGIALALGSVAHAVWTIIFTRGRAVPVVPLTGQPVNSQQEVFGYLAAQVGAVIGVVSILGWIVMTVVATNGRLFGLSYTDFLNATEGYPRPVLTFGIAIGVAFSAIDLRQVASRITLGCFAVWAVIALPIGIRGDVMFPAAAALAAQGWRLRHIPARYFIIGTIAGLSVTSTLREIRMEGISHVDWRWEVVSPGTALRELGQSLRPTYEALRWIEDGDRFIDGASFWAPFERGFLRVFPVEERPDEDAQRQLIVLVAQRVGAIGFSPVAEAYYNFGTLGVVLVMALMGLGVGALGRIGSSTLGRALMLVTLIPLLIFVRNSFSQVPGQVVAGLVLVMGIWLLATVIARRFGTASIATPVDNLDSPPADQNRPT